MLEHLLSASVSGAFESTAGGFLFRTTAEPVELKYNFLPVTFMSVNRIFTMFPRQQYCRHDRPAPLKRYSMFLIS